MPNRNTAIVAHCRAHVKEMRSCFALVGAKHGIDMIKKLKSDMEIQDSYFHIYCNNIFADPSLPSMQFRAKLVSNPRCLDKKQFYEFIDYTGQEKAVQDTHFQEIFDSAYKKALISSLRTPNAKKILHFFREEVQQLNQSLRESYTLQM